MRPLVDLTTADAFCQPVLQQQIFDETLRLIAGAQRFIVPRPVPVQRHQGALASSGNEVPGAGNPGG